MAQLAGELGIADRLLTTPHEGRRPNVSDEHLNLVYNACDVGLSTAAAEGWGLVAFEHAAAGGAQVVPDHSAGAELWPGRALMLPARPAESGGHVVSPEAVAEALARLHGDRSLREDLAARGRAFATSPELAWPAVARRWEPLLVECLRDERGIAEFSAASAFTQER